MTLSDTDMELLVDVFKTVLDDDNGVSEAAYDKMWEFADTIDHKPLNDMLYACDATDGRFYLPEGYKPEEPHDECDES